MSDPENMKAEAGAGPYPILDLDLAGRALVHDIATPLATLQLNLQVLSTYLPVLLTHYQEGEIQRSISAEHLQAMASLPVAMDADIRKIRQATQAFSSVLVQQSEQVLASPAHEQTLSPGKVHRVLLVEDEVIHQEITRKQLGDDYEITIANNAQEGLELYSSNTYDLVLLDLVLPGMDAKSLIAGLRSVGPRSVGPRSVGPQERTPIILVSNMPLNADEIEQLGVEGALAKPFSKAKFLMLLQQLFHQA